MSKSKTIELDVRDDIRNGREPFSKIMRTVSQLKPAQDLRLIAPFEPAPLYAVLAQQGFSHATRQLESNDWEVTFSKRGSSEQAATAQEHGEPNGSGQNTCAGPPVVDVDARGLEPPQPLVTILEALSSLPGGARLRAFTDRRPMHLYAQLEARGFTGESHEQPDGSFVTYVNRA